jgi:hypothetical protein
MVRTQIQLPEPLYREVKRIAREQDWSIAEVIRRGAESVARAYPAIKSGDGQGRAWSFPDPLKSKLIIRDPEALKAALQNDHEPRLP